MNKIKYSKIIIIMAGVLLLSAVVVAQQSDNTMVVFPFAVSAENPDVDREIIDQTGKDFYELVSEGLLDQDVVSILKYDHRMAQIQRAVREQKVDGREARLPIGTDREGRVKAQNYATIIGAAFAVVGSIDRFSIDQAKGESEITATVQVIEVSTGRVIDTFMAAGRSAPETSIDTHEAMSAVAVYDLAEKILSDFSSARITQTSIEEIREPILLEEVTAKPKKNKALIPAMLGALLLGYLVSN